MSDPNLTRRVDWRLKLALESGSLPRDVLVEGPAGTGKTFGILETLHVLARDYANLRILVCRQTRASLTESVLATFEEEILPADGMELLASGERRDHRTAYRYANGSRIVLGGLDKPERVLSTAWDFVFINEAIETQESAWETLRGRMVRPGRDRRFGYLLGDTNPGDPAHWINRRCEKGLTTRWRTSHAANPELFGMGGWTEAWWAFRESLASLTGPRRNRYYLGLWAAGEGSWFGTFDPDVHVTPRAEFDPRWPVHLAVDTGVHTGAVLWQVRDEPGGPLVTVFADYYSYDVAAYDNAIAILRMLGDRCGGRYDVGRCDPSGGAKSGFGATTILGEYGRAGLRLSPWLKYPGCVLSGLNLLESFVTSPGPKFLVHPRCQDLIRALTNYRRKKRGGQFIDEPEDELHPHEDLVDPIRSSLLDRFPEGRAPAPKLRRVHASALI